MFSSWSLNQKMLAAFSSVACMLLVLGGINSYVLKEVSAHYEIISKGNLPNLGDVAEMRLTSRQILGTIVRAALEDATASDVAKAKQDVTKLEAEYAHYEKAYLDVPFFEGEEKLYNAQNEHWKKAIGYAHQLLDLLGSKEPGARQQFFTVLNQQYFPSASAQFDGLEILMQFHRDLAKKNSDLSEATARWGTIFSLMAVAIGFFSALAIGFVFARSLSSMLTEVAKTLGEGAENVASASKQISEASSELSSSATEQAAALQETVSSVDEISAMVNKNADNAKRSQDVSTRSHETASRGKQAVGEVIHSIDEINQSNAEIMAQIERSNQEIAEIVKVIADIGNKTKVINDIVFQTKLLSFNASVEAARAGEHGKGFAVVAEEVGNLAQMSGNAAKEISQMLDGSIQKVEGIVNDTKTKVERLIVVGKEKVESGTVTAKNCGEILDAIVSNVNEVNQMIKEIAVASQEQSQGTVEITKAMSQLDQVTQQNASSSQESANASEALTKQAQELREVVQKLLAAVTGSRSSVSLASYEKTNVIPFKKKEKPAATVQNKRIEKRVVGGDPIPADDDQRFEDA